MTATTCTYHCAGWPYKGCNSHFHSLKAFDRHRQGPVGDRYCEDPADIDGLEPLTDDGFCALTRRGPQQQHITIWSVAADVERARAVRWNRQTPSEAQT